MTQHTLYYHVIECAGMHGSGSRVRPRSTHHSLRAALRAAQSATRSYQSAMARYGGSSGYYDVVTSAERHPVWIGHDADGLARRS